MKAKDFDTWRKYHTSIFSGFAAWWDQQDAELYRVWSEGLASVGLDSAREASKAIAFGEVADPGGFGKHLGAVRALAKTYDGQKQPQASYVNGEPVYDCGECQDTGVVAAFHPMDVADIMDCVPHRPMKPCMFACQCPRGDRWANPKEDPKRRREAIPVFRENARIEYLDHRTRTMRQSVIVRFNNGPPDVAEQAVNDAIDRSCDGIREPAFDQFNNGG